MRIVESESWQTYRAAWSECMKDYYWFKNDPVFDWNKHEELEEMETQFGKPERVFLEAHTDGPIVGVLGYRFRGKEALLRRWEPASLPGRQSESINEALLKRAFKDLSNSGVERVRVIVKRPVDTPAVAAHLYDLFLRFGFARYPPDGVDLVVKLDRVSKVRPPKASGRIGPEMGSTPEKLAAHCVRAYASTPEDMEIHGYDKSVTDFNTAVEVLRSIMAGRLGPSPSEFWKVALVDGVPAGFIGGFVQESRYRPTTGVLGPLGVFPEYRRQGIGLSLVSDLLASMSDYGCEYAAVGTTTDNHNAIRLYQKAGYRPNCNLTHLEKVL